MQTTYFRKKGGERGGSCSTGTNGDLRRLRVKSPAQTLVTGDEKVISSGGRPICYLGRGRQDAGLSYRLCVYLPTAQIFKDLGFPS